MSLYAAVTLRRTWSEVPRLPCRCGNLHWAGLTGCPSPGPSLTCAVPWRFRMRGEGNVIATVDSDYGLGTGRLLLRGR